VSSRWLLSNRTRTLFLYSSWVVVFVGIFMLFIPWIQQIQAVQIKLPLQILGGALGVVGGPAALFIWFGMVFFCAREDHSPVRSKVLWFVLFFATAPFGAVIYFFTVYRKQVQMMNLSGSR
jgi:hypothetical protein